MSELHRRITEQRPGWAVGDWHCQCGAFGNHSWEGFAWHLEQKLAEASDELRAAAQQIVNFRQGLRVTQETPAPDSWWEILFRALDRLDAALHASRLDADKEGEG